jgi:hypothetical protein
MTILSLIADIASLIGLVFSFLAFLKASTASDAAIQAKQAILKSSYADELAVVCASMDQMLDLLRHKHYLETGIKADVLALSLSELPFRRKPFLSEETQNALLNSREQLQLLAAEMRKPQVTPAMEQRSMKAAVAIAMKLREEMSKMKGNLDLEGQK